MFNTIQFSPDYRSLILQTPAPDQVITLDLTADQGVVLGLLDGQLAAAHAVKPFPAPSALPKEQFIRIDAFGSPWQVQFIPQYGQLLLSAQLTFDANSRDLTGEPSRQKIGGTDIGGVRGLGLVESENDDDSTAGKKIGSTDIGGVKIINLSSEIFNAFAFDFKDGCLRLRLREGALEIALSKAG